MRTKWFTRFKIILLPALIITLVGVTSAFAFRGSGGGYMGRGWHLNLTPKQAGQVFDLRQKFMNDTAELRKNLMVKGAELAQLWKAEQPDDKAILAKVKELAALRAQLQEKSVAHRLAVRKIVPQAMGPCPMVGPGMGMNFGPGGPGPDKGMGKGRGQGVPVPGPGSLMGPEAQPDVLANLDADWHPDY
ncbi:MAG: Spy/CpxP family protein refolding chaperone [Desulfobaccales bacterium]